MWFRPKSKNKNHFKMESLGMAAMTGAISGTANLLTSRVISSTIQENFPTNLRFVIFHRNLEMWHVDARTAGSTELAQGVPYDATNVTNNELVHGVRAFEIEDNDIREDIEHYTIVAAVKRKYAYLTSSRNSHPPTAGLFDDFSWSGSDGIFHLFQSVREFDVAGAIIRFIMRFTPGTVGQTWWMIRYHPKTKSISDKLSMIGGLMTRYASEFSVIKTYRNDWLVGFIRKQAAEQAFIESETLLGEIDLEMGDVQIDPVKEVSGQTCMHPEVQTFNKDNGAKALMCTGCKEMVGSLKKGEDL
jgi:hypothetical protein